MPRAWSSFVDASELETAPSMRCLIFSSASMKYATVDPVPTPTTPSSTWAIAASAAARFWASWVICARRETGDDKSVTGFLSRRCQPGSRVPKRLSPHQPPPRHAAQLHHERHAAFDVVRFDLALVQLGHQSHHVQAQAEV